jgi:hypothetical protein
MTNASLHGKRVLITGAARGIGAQVARELASRGARVSLVGLEPELLQRNAAGLGSGHTWCEAVVRSQADLDAATAQTERELGGIDVVLANAGIAAAGTLRSVAADEFSRVVDINLNGVYRTARATVSQLIATRGYLLVVASLASFAPMPGAASYAASKAGAESLAASLRLELAPYGVGVGSVHPSWVDTDIVRGPEVQFPTFAKMRSELPWPVNTTTSVEDCAVVIVDAMQRRARRVYIPSPARLASYTAPLAKSGALQRGLARRLGRDLTQLEQEARALGGDDAWR